MDLRTAIRNTNAEASRRDRPMAIAWDPAMSIWRSYDLVAGCPDGCEPEFVCWGLGKIPAPLNEIAAEAWCSLLREHGRGL